MNPWRRSRRLDPRRRSPSARAHGWGLSAKSLLRPHLEVAVNADAVCSLPRARQRCCRCWWHRRSSGPRARSCGATLGVIAVDQQSLNLVRQPATAGVRLQRRRVTSGEYVADLGEDQGVVALRGRERATSLIRRSMSGLTHGGVGNTYTHGSSLKSAPGSRCVDSLERDLPDATRVRPDRVAADHLAVHPFRMRRGQTVGDSICPHGAAAQARAAPPRRGIVARPRLSGRSTAVADASFTLVAAPAGYGKTVAVELWLAGRGQPQRGFGGGRATTTLSGCGRRSPRRSSEAVRRRQRGSGGAAGPRRRGPAGDRGARDRA